jgi:predicted AAA+ superfamily ATPase
MKFFNTGGVCHPDRHYMLPARQRFEDEGVSVNVERLIQRASYFVIHAPRQVGKTSAVRELVEELNASGKYVTALVSMNAGKK